MTKSYKMAKCTFIKFDDSISINAFLLCNWFIVQKTSKEKSTVCQLNSHMTIWDIRSTQLSQLKQHVL